MRISKILFFVAALILNPIAGHSFTCCCTDNPFFVSAELLYWMATEDELEYVDKFDVSVTTAILVNGRPQDIDFTWAPGSKLTLGYACNSLDAQLTWTYFYSHSDAATSSNGIDTDFLKPTWFPHLLGGLASRASANWKFHYNTIDLSVGKEFWLGGCVFIHPYTGLRAAWIDQKYNANYLGAFQFTDGGVVGTFFSDTSFDAINDFKAIGLRFGMDGNWEFCPCWSLVSGFSTSLLYGRFFISEVINGGLILDEGGGPTLVREILTLKETLHRPRFNIEGLLGLQYRKFFITWPSYLTAALFYNVVFWINQNQFINRVVAINDSPINATAINSDINESILHQKGNIQLSGFSLRVRFDKSF